MSNTCQGPGAPRTHTMAKTPRHRPRFTRAHFLLTSLATLLALADLAVAAEPGFASTDATDPYLWLEEIDSTRALDWVRAQERRHRAQAGDAAALPGAAARSAGRARLPVAPAGA